MAGETSVGDLLVRIGGNVDALVDAAKKGKSALGELDTSAGRTQQAFTFAQVSLAAAAVAIASAINSAVQKAVDRMAELGKTAQQVGIAVESLSRLEFAAKKAGVTSEELEKAIKSFARNAGEVRSALEPADKFVLTMRSLKTEFEEAGGRARPTVDVILDLADKFARMPDGVQKSRMAMELFGEAGASLIPVLNMGREKVAELMAQSDAMGATVDKGAAESARQFNNTLRSLGSTFDGLVKRVIADFLPTIETLTQQIADTVRNAGNMSMAFEGVRVVLLLLVNVATLAGAALKALFSTIGDIVSIMAKIAKGEFKEAFDIFTKSINDSLNTGLNAGKAVIQQWKESGVASGGWATTVVAANEKVAESFKPLEKTAKQAAEEHAKLRAEVVEALGRTASGPEVAILALEDALKRGEITLGEYNQALEMITSDDHKQRMRELTEILDNNTNSMSKNAATAVEKLAALDAAVRRGTVGVQVHGDMVKQVNKTNQEQMLNTATTAANTITTIFKNNKGASIAAAMINTAVGITKALATEGPWGWAQAALIGAAGAAQVAAIASTNQDGSGGSGGGAASAPAAAAAPAPAAQQEQVLRVQGLDASGMFTGDAVRTLAQRLIDFQRDGGKVILA